MFIMPGGVRGAWGGISWLWGKENGTLKPGGALWGGGVVDENMLMPLRVELVLEAIRESSLSIDMGLRVGEPRRLEGGESAVDPRVSRTIGGRLREKLRALGLPGRMGWGAERGTPPCCCWPCWPCWAANSCWMSTSWRFCCS